MRLKELRQKRKMTQQQVADALGIDRALYVRYENESRKPPIPNLKKLSDFFGVSIDYLLERSDDASIESDTFGTSRHPSDAQWVFSQAMNPAIQEDDGQWNRFIKDFLRLDPEQQEAVLRMMLVILQRK